MPAVVLRRVALDLFDDFNDDDDDDEEFNELDVIDFSDVPLVLNDGEDLK